MDLGIGVGIKYMGIANQGGGGFTVEYTATGTITSISPETVTYSDGAFSGPSAVKEFTFTDNGVDYTAYYDTELSSWVIFEGSYPYIFDDTFDSNFR